MITIIDYGSGNLRGISNAFSKIDVKTIVSKDPEIIADAEFLVLPGVGAFGQAMKNIEPYRKILIEHIGDGKPFIGVCLGLQLLLSSSEETPNVKGLDIFKGKVKKIPKGKGLRIPHMGWNRLNMTRCEITKSCSIIDGANRDYFYFVHSYHAVPDDEEVIAGITNYGMDLTAVLHRDNVFATQFHPEKSGIPGLKILKNFVDMNI
jgi:glutamine amidotransferase